MRTPLLALATSAALLASACSDGNEQGGPAEGPIPEFAADENTTNEGLVGRGDVSQRPPAAEASSLTIDGDIVALRDGSCLQTGVPIEGVTGYQAAFAEEEGNVDVEIVPDAGTATVRITRDGTTEEYPDVQAEVINEAWYLESQATGAGDQIPQIIVNFTCPDVGEVGEEPGNLQNRDLQGADDEGADDEGAGD